MKIRMRLNSKSNNDTRLEMSSIIRSPKVGEQPRVLKIDKAQNVSPLRSDDYGVVRDESEITYGGETIQDDLELAGDADVGSSPGNYYSKEVSSQVKDMAAKLAATTEELEQLREEIDSERQNAAETGYDEGYEKGLADAESEIADRVRQLDELIFNVKEKIDERIYENRDAMVEIAFAAITKMLGELLPTKEGAIAAVRNAIQFVSNRDKLIFRVSERDYQLIKDNASQITSNSDSSDIKIIPDNQVQLGGCILESSSGGLDSRLEIQLNTLIKTLKHVNSKNNEEN